MKRSTKNCDFCGTVWPASRHRRIELEIISLISRKLWNPRRRIWFICVHNIMLVSRYSFKTARHNMKNKTDLILMGFHSQCAQLGWLPVDKKVIIYAKKKNHLWRGKSCGEIQRDEFFKHSIFAVLFKCNHCNLKWFDIFHLPILFAY